MSSRDAARGLVAKFCRDNHLQLLDQTVALRKISISRKRNGNLGLVRVFRFDYSENGFQRQDGMIWMLANRPTQISVQINEQQVVEDLRTK